MSVSAAPIEGALPIPLKMVFVVVVVLFKISSPKSNEYLHKESDIVEFYYVFKRNTHIHDSHFLCIVFSTTELIKKNIWSCFILNPD